MICYFRTLRRYSRLRDELFNADLRIAGPEIDKEDISEETEKMEETLVCPDLSCQQEFEDRTYFVDKNLSPNSHAVLGRYYENLVIKKLKVKPFNFDIYGNAKKGKDGGIDFTGTWLDFGIVGQCKFYKSKSVAVPIVREWNTVIANYQRLKQMEHDATIGVIVASVPLSSEAFKLFMASQEAMIFGRLIPESSLPDNVNTSNGFGWMKSLMWNKRAKEILDGRVEIVAEYDESLSQALNEPCRQEGPRYLK